ncbi:unnamed protein product [Pipistrellus nathusii]|uniref:Uncharacterized protein n=1 Tax=Pipistrellus nathusii TaxID=59473 RepID=A0ABP0ALE5_PIPNA
MTGKLFLFSSSPSFPISGLTSCSPSTTFKQTYTLVYPAIACLCPPHFREWGFDACAPEAWAGTQAPFLTLRLRFACSYLPLEPCLLIRNPRDLRSLRCHLQAAACLSSGVSGSTKKTGAQAFQAPKAFHAASQRLLPLNFK